MQSFPFPALFASLILAAVSLPAAETPSTAPLPSGGIYDWGLNLPRRAVPRRIEQGGIRIGVGKPTVLERVFK